MDTAGQDGSTLLHTVNVLANLALRFGPFFFAIVFMFVIPRTARKWYMDSNTRVPAADISETKAFRQYFVISWYFGIFLVLLSIAWWVYINFNTRHVFEGVIVDLSENQSFSSDDFYYRQVPKPIAAFDPSVSQETLRLLPRLHDYDFVIVRDRPVHNGERIFVRYWELNKNGDFGAPPTPEMVPLDLSETQSSPKKFVLHNVNGQLRLDPVAEP